MNEFDKTSLEYAKKLFLTNDIQKIEIGTIKGLQQIHRYLFVDLYDFAGVIRTKNISKGDFIFANSLYLEDNLRMIEEMPYSTLEEIIAKYVEMNIVHPFFDGNGRSMRIWLDLMLKKSINKIVNWANINKDSYLSAMKISTIDLSKIKLLIEENLTDDFGLESIYKSLENSYYFEVE